jgi:Fic family protein
VNKEVVDGGVQFYQLVPRGEFRHIFCYAIHEEEKREIHYCPWKSINVEMKWYFSEAQRLLERTDLDPFYVSAWLQWSFLYIHPFADGNGRVARMISSIPLLKCKLPPVVFVQQRKLEYLDALFDADRKGDLTPLAEFMKKESDAAISFITSLETDVQQNKGPDTSQLADAIAKLLI